MAANSLGVRPGQGKSPHNRSFLRNGHQTDQTGTGRARGRPDRNRSGRPPGQINLTSPTNRTQPMIFHTAPLRAWRVAH